MSETINEGEWQTLKVDEDYEININYPHDIRNKKNKRILKGYYDKSNGYYIYCLNEYLVLAFNIPNDLFPKCISFPTLSNIDQRE